MYNRRHVGPSAISDDLILFESFEVSLMREATGNSVILNRLSGAAWLARHHSGSNLKNANDVHQFQCVLKRANIRSVAAKCNTRVVNLALVVARVKL